MSFSIIHCIVSSVKIIKNFLSQYYIINHSIYHRDYPNQKGFIRGVSHLTGDIIPTHSSSDSFTLTGFLVTPLGRTSCTLGYVAHSDPGGQLPSWVTNKLSSILAPKMVKRIHKACLNYVAWKVGELMKNIKITFTNL